MCYQASRHRAREEFHNINVKNFCTIGRMYVWLEIKRLEKENVGNVTNEVRIERLVGAAG
jgi:hypothetical protein